MSAALLCGMQANATRQMGLFGRIEQRWGVFRYTLEGHCGLIQPASSAKQTAQQGHEGGADEGDTAAGHKLLHALAFRAGVVRAITFQQVNTAPHAKASAQGHNEGLQDFDCAIEKFMVISSLQ